ncbi:tetratricopeptide repeat protein [Paenibacillus caui]|uniref:tetratricopeptide repeat protein n=1 Tax=Paenibacillus caui TaxID=2873927 RepID=UPI001CA9945D|nr:tetratricopeptide repeat protein [Paenibacillus caui]
MQSTLQEAIELRNAGRAEEAKAMLLELLEEDKDNPMLLYQLAWTHDSLGLEREAVPFYEQSLANGLPEEQRPGALLGLGSTCRTLGEYEKSKEIFEIALRDYPAMRQFRVFYAMVLYNLGEHADAMNLLLTDLVDTTSDPGILKYQRAIRFYADKLDQVWK